MKILMVGPDPKVKGGISAIISHLIDKDELGEIIFLSSYMDYNSKVKKLLKGIASYFRCIHLMIKEKPDLVHIHTSFGASFYRKSVFFFLCKLFKTPTINHIHGAEFNEFYNTASKRKKRLIKKIYKYAKATIVLSNSWEKDLKEIVDNDIYVLNNFTDIRDDISEYDSEFRNKQVVFMGEVGKRKGAYDLPNIIEEVVKQSIDVQFKICGNGDVKKIKQLLIDKNLQNNAELTGWISGSEKHEYLNSSTVFLLPTYNEGQPMAIIEAMSYKLPIVSTTVGGIPELIKDDVNGYLFEPGDTLGFSQAIIKLLKDKELAKEMSKNNFELVTKSYSLDGYVKKLANIYEELIQ